MSSAGVKDLCKVCDERGRGKGEGAGGLSNFDIS